MKSTLRAPATHDLNVAAKLLEIKQVEDRFSLTMSTYAVRVIYSDEELDTFVRSHVRKLMAMYKVLIQQATYAKCRKTVEYAQAKLVEIQNITNSYRKLMVS